jgi:hypothetical protein
MNINMVEEGPNEKCSKDLTLKSKPWSLLVGKRPHKK